MFNNVHARALAGCAVALVGSGVCDAANDVDVGVTAALTDSSVRFGLLDVRIALSEHWAASLGVAYLDPAVAADEMQFRVSALGVWQLDEWSLDNRHLLSISSAALERYRSRVRIARSGVLGSQLLSVRAYDEIFVDLERSRLFRNNLAAGIGLQFTKTLNAEIYHVWEMNRSASDRDFVLVLVAWRFGGQR